MFRRLRHLATGAIDDDLQWRGTSHHALRFEGRERIGQVEKSDLVGVVAERILGAIGDQQRQLLPLALFFGESLDIMTLGREAHTEWRISAGGNGRENVDGGLERKR